MNDLDTTIKALVNSAVDRELGGHRAAPPWDGADSLDRNRPARPITAWKGPVLAASVAGLLAAGSVLAIEHGRDDRSNQGSPAGPTPSVSVSRSVSTDLERAASAYSEAMAGALEATEVAGVTVGPLSARDAARLKGTGLFTGDISGITAPTPGKTYSFTLSYLAGPSDDPPAVLTSEVQDVASSSCAPPFLARPGHAYRIQCRAMLLAGATGKGTLTLRTPTGTMSGSMNLTDLGKNPASPPASASTETDQARAAREYSEAVARAPEASKAAGVTDRPAGAEAMPNGEIVEMVGGPIVLPEPGKSYQVTLRLIPPLSGGITVLTTTIEQVSAWRCPPPFRSRPGHAYLIRCQVTFLPGVVGMARLSRRAPNPEWDSTGVRISAQ